MCQPPWAAGHSPERHSWALKERNGGLWPAASAPFTDLIRWSMAEDRASMSDSGGEQSCTIS